MAVSIKNKFWCIYKITSPSGKIYIGKTVDFSRRVRSYRERCEPKQRLLYRSFFKYGFDKHTIEIIEEGILTNRLSSEREKYWIAEYKCNQNKWRNGIGLNLTDGGEGTAGLKHNRSKEVSEKVKQFRIDLSGVPIVQYGLNGDIIKEFKAMRTAASELGISRTTLKNILRGNTSYTYLPYTFRFKGEHFNKVVTGVRGKKTGLHVSNSNTLIEKYGKPIIQLNMDGSFVKEYDSITVAAKHTGYIRQNILFHLKGKSKHLKGFLFKYKATG